MNGPKKVTKLVAGYTGENGHNLVPKFADLGTCHSEKMGIKTIKTKRSMGQAMRP